MLAPNQIEADLAFRGIDIGWWHRLTLDEGGAPKLSSRRLLALLDGLPEDSAYQTARRDGQWPTWQRMLKEIHKESALMRASKFADSDDPELSKYTMFLDPIEGLEAAAEQQRKDDETADIMRGF
jgi:hypothetical protein